MRPPRRSENRDVPIAIGLWAMALCGAVVTTARNSTVGLTWFDVLIGPLVLAGCYLTAQAMGRKHALAPRFASMIDATYLLITWAWLLQGRVDPMSARFTLFWAVVATVMLGVGFQVGRLAAQWEPGDAERRWWALGVAAASVLAMVVTALFGSTTLGSRISLEFMGFSLQPGEFARVGLVFAAACLLSRGHWFVAPAGRSLRGLAVLTAFVLIALVLQKDLSPAVLLLVVFSAMVWLYHGRGAKPILFVLGSGAALAVVAGFIGLRGSARGARFDQYFDPYAPLSANSVTPSQLGQALLAYRRGGYLGSGWGMGFPETVPLSQSDFILTVAAEELGFVGLFVVFVGAFVLLVRGWRVARDARTPVTRLFAGGLVFMLAFSWIFTLAGTFGFTPHGGLAVPFLSRGGSSLLASTLIVGILLGIGHESRLRPAIGAGGDGSRPEDRAEHLARWSGTVAVAVLIISLLLPLPPFDRVPRPGHTSSSKIAKAQAIVTRGYEQAAVDRGRVLAADGTTVLAVTWKPGEEACSAWNSGNERPKRPRRCYPEGARYSDVVGVLAPHNPVAMEDFLAPALTSCLDRGEGVLAGLERGLIGPSCRRHGDVALTLDPELQDTAFEALKDQSGTAIVLEVETGNVLALATTEGYDPELHLKPFGKDKKDKPAVSPPPDSLPRRKTIPAGSVIKVVTALAAAEAEGGDVASVSAAEARAVELRGEPACFGSLDDIIARSCNRGVAALARRTGADQVDQVASDLGFGKEWTFDGLSMACSPLLISGAGEKTCRNPEQESADRRSSGLAYLPVTALQIAIVGSAIAGGGSWVEPRFIADPATRRKLGEETTPVSHSVVSRAAAEEVLHAMRATTQARGTAAGQFDGMDVAAKTGTPQRDLEGGRIQDAWLLAIAPSLAPKYVVVVWLSGVGSDGKMHGADAGPIVRSLLEEALD